MGTKASTGELNQWALGSQNISDYLNKFAPIESQVANDLLSTSGNEVEKGRTKAATGMALRAATQPALAANLAATGPTSGAFVAKALEMNRRGGSAQGMAQVQTVQDQADRKANRLSGGMEIGRSLQGVTTGAMRGTDVAAHNEMIDDEKINAEKSARRYGMAGEAIGAGLGGYLQYKAMDVPQNNGRMSTASLGQIPERDFRALTSVG